MAVQLDSAGGAVLGKTVAKLGVAVHCGVQATEILRSEEGNVRGLRFEDKSELKCEMVVISAGIRANQEIGREAGLPAERGIVVNDWMQTEDPDVYAVGECAQHAGKVYGLVAPIYDQCAILAGHLIGDDDRERRRPIAEASSRPTQSARR